MNILEGFSSLVIAPNLLAALIGIPSALLYSAQVFIVLACRNQQQFNSSFFHLFVVRALPSIFNLFSSYWALRFGLLDLFFPLYQGMPNWLLNFLFFSTYYTFHVENLSTTILLFNRFTSIAFAFSYEKIWRKWVFVADLVIFCIPLAITWPIFGAQMRAHYFGDKNESFGVLDLDAEFPCSQFVAHSGALFLVICTLLNLGSWLIYRRKYAGTIAKVHQQIEGQQNAAIASGLNKIELHLFVYAFATFICQSIMTALYYGIFLASLHFTASNGSSKWAKIWMDLLFNNYGLVNDICTVAVPAWLMLFSCAKMREILFGFLAIFRASIAAKFRILFSSNSTTRTSQNGKCSRIEGRLYCENNFVDKI